MRKRKSKLVETSIEESTKHLLVALSKKDRESLGLLQKEFTQPSMTATVRLCIRYMREFMSNDEFWSWVVGAGLLTPEKYREKREGVS